jgi:chemotaxis protein CheD
MTEYILNIGDVIISEREAQYTCFGLGSCIGLFIHDRLSRLSAGAHILLPEDEKGLQGFAKFYNVVGAIHEILRQLKSKGSTLESLRAKIVGGANVLNINTFTGSRNVDSVVKQLTANKIFIAAMDVGGVYGRTAKFESATGVLTVKLPQPNECKIL